MIYEQQPFYKIQRDICLIKYRNLPLREYDEKLQEDIYYIPPTTGFYWLKSLEKPTKITDEYVALFKALKLDSFVFMCDENKPWISKFTSNRTDSKALTKAIEYFIAGKVKSKFNGGILVHYSELSTFLRHFYTLVSRDGGFCYYHFTDDKNDFVFSIHYSGELMVMALNKKADKRLHTVISQTKFVDSERVNTDRIGKLN